MADGELGRGRYTGQVEGGLSAPTPATIKNQIFQKMGHRDADVLDDLASYVYTVYTSYIFIYKKKTFLAQNRKGAPPFYSPLALPKLHQHHTRSIHGGYTDVAPHLHAESLVLDLRPAYLWLRTWSSYTRDHMRQEDPVYGTK